MGSRTLERRLNSSGARAQLLPGMWDLPGPGIEPTSPSLASGFITTETSGKPIFIYLMNTSIIHVANIHAFSGYYIPEHHCWTREIQINKTWYLPRVTSNAGNLSCSWYVHFYPSSCRSFHHSRYQHPCSSCTDISLWLTPNDWRLKKIFYGFWRSQPDRAYMKAWEKNTLYSGLCYKVFFCSHHKIILKPLNYFKK